eukprot:3148348-Alexandrium_andersonii.AAC.1
MARPVNRSCLLWRTGQLLLKGGGSGHATTSMCVFRRRKRGVWKTPFHATCATKQTSAVAKGSRQVDDLGSQAVRRASANPR